MPAQDVVVEQHACDDERACKRAAPRFVRARDVACTELPIVAEEALAAAQGHAAENSAALRTGLRRLRIGFVQIG
jgi:hypothetical protein